MDQSSPDFYRRTREESLSITCLCDFGYLYPFRRYSRSNFEVVRNRPTFCTFLAPNFFLWGGPPKFRDLDYQIQEPSDQLAKFRGDRPTEIGDLALKKTSAVKHKSTWNYRSGWPNERTYINKQKRTVLWKLWEYCCLQLVIHWHLDHLYYTKLGINISPKHLLSIF